MREAQIKPFQLSFNASLKVDFQGSRVTSDDGLIFLCELDERLGSGESTQQHLTDSCRRENTQIRFFDLPRQSVYSRSAGYENPNDAERLSQATTFRMIASEKIWNQGATLASRLPTFGAELRAQEEKFAGVAQLGRAVIGDSQEFGAGEAGAHTEELAQGGH